MQSLRQYRAIKSAVAVQIATGKIINVSNEKISVLDEQASSDSTTTTSLNEKAGSRDPIIVGWEGPNGMHTS